MPKKAYIERRNGKDHVVIERSGSSSRPSTAELLIAAEQREASLIAENAVLRNRLSIAERDSWELRNLTADYQRLINEHQQCRNLRAQLDSQIRETRRVEGRLDDEKVRTRRLTEALRGLRTIEERYIQKRDEVEVLTRMVLEHQDALALWETRIAEKDRRIAYLRRLLRQLGVDVD